MLLSSPETLSWRPQTKGGLPVPYNSHITDDGLLEWATPDQERWFECVKQKKCAYCGMKLGYWIHFLVANDQMQKFGGKYFFTDPAMHPDCAEFMWEVMRGLIRTHSIYKDKSFWSIYVTRAYQIATLTPPPEARATGATSLVRLSPAPPKEIRDLIV